MQGERVRRARVLEDDEWRLIRPHQDWEDGEVSAGYRGMTQCNAMCWCSA